MSSFEENSGESSNVHYTNIHAWVCHVELCYALLPPLQSPLPPVDESTARVDSVPLAGQLPPTATSCPSEPELLCYSCGAPEPRLKCGKCKVASYCSKECQKKDWKGGSEGGWHKMNCGQYKLLTRAGTFPGLEHKKEAVDRGVLQKIRLYLSPFYVHHVSKGEGGCDATNGDGGGFVFLQSNNTLEQLSMPGNTLRDCRGPTLPERRVSRQIFMRFMATSEFRDLAGDDFEMMQLQKPLLDASKDHDSKRYIPVLFRARCGFVAVFLSNIALGYEQCRRLGWEDMSAVVQLNLD